MHRSAGRVKLSRTLLWIAFYIKTKEYYYIKFLSFNLLTEMRAWSGCLW
ncbi:hypothetical protein [Leptospira noguchii]|uniref:Uncharacterized protein n=1 Tax=Leptospira noguchii TaxID=28182 RepID=A0AAE9G8M6_9LEPT|nr:hypothetical protein [Leptospira noguchii]UOG29623.1 hypothetical protein MAL06_13295 [Leptospira noguchii]UOG55759.1 hypothetical protein MAL03_12865 [Leptospira noguchii]